MYQELVIVGIICDSSAPWENPFEIALLYFQEHYFLTPRPLKEDITLQYTAAASAVFYIITTASHHVVCCS